MPSVNVTIDDSSPLINYQPVGAWSEAVGNGEQSYGGSSTTTVQQGASVQFSFNGTSVTVYGSKTDNHGTYTVALDGYEYNYDGFGAWPGVFQTPIFSADSLRQGTHMVTITNAQWMVLDIDYITWTSNISTNDPSSWLANTTVQDTDSAFLYFPKGAWNMNPPNVSSFSGGTGHSTSQLQASVNYTFTGDVVSLYGTVGPQNSDYAARLDDGPPETIFANRPTWAAQVLLFHADNLGAGNHTLTVVNQEGGKLLDIDYAVVERLEIPLQTTSSQMMTSSTTPSASSTSGASTVTATIISLDPVPQHSSLPPGAIAGIVIASVLFMLLLLALCHLALRNKALWTRLQRGYMVQSQFDSPFPSTYALNTYSTPHTPRIDTERHPRTAVISKDAPEMVPLHSPVSFRSGQTGGVSSLLVENGSQVSPVQTLRLVTPWGVRGKRRSDAPRGPRAPARTPSMRGLLAEAADHEGPGDDDDDDEGIGDAPDSHLVMEHIENTEGLLLDRSNGTFAPPSDATEHHRIPPRTQLTRSGFFLYD